MRAASSSFDIWIKPLTVCLIHWMLAAFALSDLINRLNCHSRAWFRLPRWFRLKGGRGSGVLPLWCVVGSRWPWFACSCCSRWALAQRGEIRSNLLLSRTYARVRIASDKIWIEWEGWASVCRHIWVARQQISKKCLISPDKSITFIVFLQFSMQIYNASLLKLLTAGFSRKISSRRIYVTCCYMLGC